MHKKSSSDAKEVMLKLVSWTLQCLDLETVKQLPASVRSLVNPNSLGLAPVQIVKVWISEIPYSRDYKYPSVPIEYKYPYKYEVPGCQATPYYFAYDYKYPTQVKVLIFNYKFE